MHKKVRRLKYIAKGKESGNWYQWQLLRRRGNSRPRLRRRKPARGERLYQVVFSNVYSGYV